MELVTPGIGLVFWMTISFLVVFFLLAKFAWKPILRSLHEREESIDSALASAEKAKKEMEELNSRNEAMLIEAREERDQIMKEARETKSAVIAEAKSQAKIEADKVLSSAREEIKNEKAKAIQELKKEVADISFEIAEKILQEKLSDGDKQKESVKKALNEINFN
ncbi:MAG: F0F1 ATP synthase subunit B [Salibacteraceae bacterium]